MQLIFGLALDELSLPRPALEGGAHYCGKKKLLQLLEDYLGLGGYQDNIDYLRVEQYRQAIIRLLDSDGEAEKSEKQTPFFFQKSFEADQFATSAELLSRRDELRLAGWDFKCPEDTPDRLATLAAIENIFIQEKEREKGREEEDARPLFLSPGYADRFVEALKVMDERALPFTEIRLNEPFELLPCHFKRLFKKMSESGLRPPIRQTAEAPQLLKEPTSDLQEFQRRLLSDQSREAATEKAALTNDGSLLLLRAKRAGEAAAWLAQLIRLNRLAPSLHPESGMHLLVPEQNRMLEMALIAEGLPSLGMQSASLARPTLQILKLVSAFLWRPIDPFKILEFVSLAVKPLPDELATLIANQIAAYPGLGGEGWYAMVRRYFEELAENESDAAVREQRRQYDFWFERPRYDMSRSVPKGEVQRIFEYLHAWSYEAYEEGGGRNHSLLVLNSQSRRIVELLKALPETELSYLELERIVRTIYEPSPVVFQEKEAKHIPYVMHPGAFTGEVESVWWWDFIQNDPPHFFPKWFQRERDYLEKFGIRTDTPDQENACQRWQQARPALMAVKRLVLVLPETINGAEALPHPLFGNLQAAFSNLEAATHCLGQRVDSPFAAHFVLPEYEEIKLKQLGSPQAFLRVRKLDKLDRERETLTSLEALFYYPYQWFFRYKLRLSNSSILSVVKDEALMGNLAHRVFERILKKDIYQLDRAELEKMVEQEVRQLLVREGAVLLMYGREPERVHFVNKMKYATWALIRLIRENGWKVAETEKSLEGVFPVNSDTADLPVPVKGIADLVLERGGELAVVDLKWRGGTYRENMLKNREDLQLVLYARLLSSEKWAHTGYFIIENGRMLTRNNQAFAGIPPVAPAEDFRAVNESILQKMEATWRWRMGQLAQGKIEVRCRQTLQDIEDCYADEEQAEIMFQILEMKSEDARYDDYRTLINLL